MKTRRLGHTNIQVSEMGLGAWQLGADWGEVEESEALAILHAAADSGVTLIDTADVYGAGRSETLIGRFLKERNETITVISKLGRFPEPGWPDNLTREWFRKHTEASLQRLGIESLPLTQMHCLPTDFMLKAECFEWLRELKNDGLIQNFGASVESMDEALFCMEQEGLASLQIIFNLFRQKPINTIFDVAKEKEIGLVIRLPLASGLLAGKMTRDRVFPENDHRNYNRDGRMFNVGETFAGLPFTTGVDLAEALNRLVPDGMTMAQFAMRWILDHDAVSVVIPGARTRQQAHDNATCSELPPLSPELHQELESFYREEVHRHIRGPY